MTKSQTHVTLTRSSSMSFMALGGSMAPSMVVLLNTPLILLPILLMPNDSPRFDVFLQTKHKVSCHWALTRLL